MLDAPMHLCWECLAALSIVTEPFCAQCGDPVDGVTGVAYRCSWCRRHEPRFALARSAVRYRGPIRAALHAFKYNRDVCLADDLGRLLAACVQAHFSAVRFDGVTGVPLYARRERVRTYNQSSLLAQAAGRRLGIPPLPARTVRRVRDTPTQTGLTAAQRRANVRHAFVVPDATWLEGRTVLLVDDVMTTGATVSECARVLRESGAAGVYVVTVARG